VQQRLAANFGASVRALRLSSATQWTQRNIIHTAATSFRYASMPYLCGIILWTRQAQPAKHWMQHDEFEVTQERKAVNVHRLCAPDPRAVWMPHGLLVGYL